MDIIVENGLSEGVRSVRLSQVRQCHGCRLLKAVESEENQLTSPGTPKKGRFHLRECGFHLKPKALWFPEL